MPNQDFERQYQEKKQIIEEALPCFLPPAGTAADTIDEAMRYAVMNGGKRLRPILMLEAAGLAGGNPEAILPAACALEMVHCYSLVHDDLPAMDNDDLRRGKPTCHRVFGEDMAILAGDALLTLAFETLAKLSVEPGRVVQTVKELGQAAGWAGMVGGQVIDLQSSGRLVEPEVLTRMHRLKTGAMIRCALRMGVILAGGDEGLLCDLTSFGEALGLAFQIIDDILDVAGSQDLLGKPVGSDEKNAKPTFVRIHGMEASRLLAEQEVQRALNALQGLGPEADFLRQLTLSQLHRQQ